MLVRIYQPAKTAMQSGRAKTGGWLLEPDDATARAPDPLMGWISAGDTVGQVKIRFDTKEDAIAFANSRGLPYVVQEPRQRRVRPKAYADNFAADRAQPWTH